jgi:hypothetical protein
LTVNETAAEPPYYHEDGTNSINWPRNLALEATFINHNFSQQVLKTGEEKYEFENANPFLQEDEEGEIASVAYRYRKWDLGDNVELVVRCEHDSVMIGPNGETQFVNIKALNEWDPRVSISQLIINLKSIQIECLIIRYLVVLIGDRNLMSNAGPFWPMNLKTIRVNSRNGQFKHCWPVPIKSNSGMNFVFLFVINC